MSAQYCGARFSIMTLLLAIFGCFAATGILPAADDASGEYILLNNVSGLLHVVRSTRQVVIVTRHDHPLPAIAFGSHISIKKGSAELTVAGGIRIRMTRRQEIYVNRNARDRSLFIAAAPNLPSSVKMRLGATTIALYRGSSVHLNPSAGATNRIKAFQGKVTVISPDGIEEPLAVARR